MTKRNKAAAAICLAAVGLTACSQGGKMAANSKICADFAAGRGAAPMAADGAAPLDDCVRRWAYSLASSKDDADLVADAAATACSPQLQRWNQQSLAQGAAEEQSASILTGEPTNPLAEHNTFAHDRALFYVVQARAGRCAPPPANNGAPEGVS